MSDYKSQTSTQLVTTSDAEMTFAPCDVPSDFSQQVQMSQILSRAGQILPSHLRNQPEAIHAEMIAARSLNLPMWTAFQHLHVIDGRVEMSARLMTALIRRAGHRIESVEEKTGYIQLRLVRCDDHVSTYTATYTRADADQANLTGKMNWSKYPADMLFSRCVSRLVRRWAPEVTMGAYLIGEVPAEADTDEDIATMSARDLLDQVDLSTTRAEVIALGKRARYEGLCPVYLDGLTLEDRIKTRLHDFDDAVQDTDDVVDAEIVHDRPGPTAPCGCSLTAAAMHGKQCPGQMTSAFGPDWEDEHA